MALALTQGPYFVQGSWVNVRADASANAAVTAHVVTNTRVVVVTTQGGACEIRWGGGHGFVPCKLLGAQALTLAALEPDDTRWGWREDHNSPLRAFWAAPSAERLFAAGLYFQRTLLGDVQFNLEQGHGQEELAPTAPVPAKLVRYAVPEFEAMKGVLARGLVAPLKAPLTSCGACGSGAAPGLALPPARPSFFDSPTELGAAAEGVEGLSARLGIMEKGEVLGGPQWVLDYDVWRYGGAWDIGHYRLTLTKPLVEVVIGRSGLVGDYRWTPSENQFPNGPEPACTDSLEAQRRGRERLPDYPRVKDPLIWIEVPAALPFRHAAVKTRVLKLKERIFFPGVNNNWTLDRVVSYTIDLDGDGVPDLVEWLVGDGESSNESVHQYLRRDFVNAGGHWYLLDVGEVTECT